MSVSFYSSYSSVIIFRCEIAVIANFIHKLEVVNKINAGRSVSRPLHPSIFTGIE